MGQRVVLASDGHRVEGCGADGELVNRFLAHLGSRAFSPATVRAYAYDLLNICEQCDNYVTAPEFIPQLQAQLADVPALRDDAAQRGWHTEVARHSRVIARL